MFISFGDYFCDYIIEGTYNDLGKLVAISTRLNKMCDSMKDIDKNKLNQSIDFLISKAKELFKRTETEIQEKRLLFIDILTKFFRSIENSDCTHDAFKAFKNNTLKQYVGEVLK